MSESHVKTMTPNRFYKTTRSDGEEVTAGVGMVGGSSVMVVGMRPPPSENIVRCRDIPNDRSAALI